MSRWEDRDLPTLQAVAKAEEDGAVEVSPGDLAQLLGLTSKQVATSLETLLDAGFITGKPLRAWADVPLIVVGSPRLLERGLRAIGEWPPTDTVEAFAQLLEERIEAEADPDKRSKLARLRDATIDLGTGTAGSVLATLIQRMAGF